MSLTRIPECPVVYCPAPTSPSWHSCLVCGRQGVEHHHTKPRGMGGSKSRKMDTAGVVPLCREHHEMVTLRYSDGILKDVYVDGVTGKVDLYRIWDLHNETIFEKVIRREEERAAAEAGASEEVGGDVGGTIKRVPGTSRCEGGGRMVGRARTQKDRTDTGDLRAPSSPSRDGPDRELSNLQSEVARGEVESAAAEETAASAGLNSGDAMSPTDSAAAPSSSPIGGSPAEASLGKFTETGWEPPRFLLSDNQIMAVIAEFHREVKQRQWRHGDFANHLIETRSEEAWQFLDEFGYDHHRLTKIMAVCEVFTLSRRRESLHFSHHETVYAQDLESQEIWLDEAEAKGWDHKTLRREIAARPPAPPLPAGTFDVILADPPWPYDNQIESWGPTSLHYSAMSLENICRLDEVSGTPFPFADNAVLFLWVTNPFARDAFQVIDAWDFKYKTNIVWIKRNLTRPGSGFYVRGRHELLFICTRGKMVPDQQGREPIGSVLETDVMEHSRKPDEMYELIESLYPEGKYLELFARSNRTGWTPWGDDSSITLADASAND